MILSEFCKEHQLKWLEFVIDWDQSATQRLQQGGVEIYNLSDTEFARWQQLLNPLVDEYIANMTAKGLPGRESVEVARKLTYYER